MPVLAHRAQLLLRIFVGVFTYSILLVGASCESWWSTLAFFLSSPAPVILLRRELFTRSTVSKDHEVQLPNENSSGSSFIRENPYVVLKASDLQAVGLTEVELDLLKAVCIKVDQYRRDCGKPDLECVVVEKDWPEYEPTWQAIEQRVAASA